MHIYEAVCMKKLIQAFKTDKSYQKEVSKYGLTDGILAIAFYIILMLAYYLLGLYQATTKIYLGGPVNLTLTALCILLVVLRKNGIKSLGFKKEHAIESLITGLALGILIVLCNVVVGLANKNVFAPIGTILSKFFYYMVIISLTEELIFRGYIQSRIFGLIHNNAAATILVAIMFVLMHIPYHLSVAKISLFQFCQDNGIWFVSLFIWHLVFTYLYRKYNSILASTIFHALMDWSNILFI
jgi:uncharacterized protein